MVAMTAAFLAERRREGCDLYPLADIFFPGGTSYISSSPCLHYNPIVLEGGFGDAREGFPLQFQGGSIEKATASLKVDDPDRAITRIIKGGLDPRRSRALLRWGGPRLATTDWYTWYDGILQDWAFEGTSVQLNFATDARALDGGIPKQPVLAGAFRGAPSTSLGIYLPIVYGIHDSSSLSGAGMVPTVCISFDATLGYRYCPTIRRAHAVPRVYKNKASQTIVADPPGAGQVSITYPMYGGLRVTSINFGTAPAATDVITCDIEGLTVDGTAAGAVILNPVDQLKDLIVQHIYGDLRGDTLLADSTAPIDTASFALASTYAQQFLYEGSRKYGGAATQPTALQAIQDWLASHPMLRLYWRRTGKLAIAVLDHRFPGYLSTPWIKEELDAGAGSSLRQTPDSSQLSQRVNLSYLFGEADSKYWSSLAVQDLRVVEKTALPLQFPWSSSRLV